jgi:hypothetical protein
VRFLVLLAFLGSFGCATGTATVRPTPPPDAAPQMLQALLAEHWAALLDYAPHMATFLGIPGHDDRWPEVGELPRPTGRAVSEASFPASRRSPRPG